MKFDSNSVMLRGGSQLKLDVYIPAALLSIDIPDNIWQSAVDNFNEKLNKRSNVTIEINGIGMDVIKCEVVREVLEIGAIVLLVVMREDDYGKIADTIFRLNGYLTFSDGTDIVDEMTITNICYDESKFLLEFGECS